MLLYIDPGTGSMLFTVLISVIGASIYSLRMLFIKLRYKFCSSNKKDVLNEKKIPFVIFSDDKRYWTIFKPICEKLSTYGKEILYLTGSSNDPALECKLENFKAEYVPGNKMYAKLNFMEANVLLSTTPGLDVYQWKRAKGVDSYVHIPHAAGDLTLYRMFGTDYYDTILVSGDFQKKSIRALEELRNLPKKEIISVGIPYMDEMVNRLEHADPIEEHPRTVLLAPSWGSSALFSVYGSRIIDVLLATGYHIIVRPHPQSFISEKKMIDELMNKYPNSSQLEWNRDNDNFEVLRRSDILISDFSSVIFDFTLVYDKPVIYTDPNFDMSVYDAWWLSDEIWTVSALKRLGIQLTEDNIKNLKELIDTCITDCSFAEGRRSVKEETWENFGNGTKLATEYLIKKYESLVS